jgi:hypothetical protein
MKWRPGGGSRGTAPLILHLRARHIVWSMSCCSQSPCPNPGEITSDTHWIGGWVGRSWSSVLRREKSLAPEGIRTADCPALSSVTRLTILRHSRKQRCRHLYVVSSCKFHYYWWSLSDDIKLRFEGVKLSLWVHWGSGGTASFILNLGTRWDWVVTFTLCQLHVWRKSPWDTSSMRLVTVQSQFWCQLNKGMHWTVWTHCVISARHLAHFTLAQYRV